MLITHKIAVALAKFIKMDRVEAWEHARNGYPKDRSLVPTDKIYTWENRLLEAAMLNVVFDGKDIVEQLTSDHVTAIDNYLKRTPINKLPVTSKMFIATVLNILINTAETENELLEALYLGIKHNDSNPQPRHNSELCLVEHHPLVPAIREFIELEQHQES